MTKNFVYCTQLTQKEFKIKPVKMANPDFAKSTLFIQVVLSDSVVHRSTNELRMTE